MAESKTILLADDSVTIQKVVELTFMDENFRVVPVGNGAEAIAWLGESTPDVVITDVHMPGADGYEVCRRSKEIHPEVPVLLLVGTFEAFDADAAARSGADGHLKKPFDSQELLRRVRDLASASRLASPSPAFSKPAAPAELSAHSPAAEIEDQIWEPLPDEGVELPDLPAYSPALEAEEPEPASAATAFVPFQTPPPASPPPAPMRGHEAPPATSFSAGLAAPAAAGGPLSDADVDRIARRVIELLGDKPIRDVAWEVVPDLAEVLLKTRIRELEASVE
jgi:CheY-like chemotaxis protein